MSAITADLVARFSPEQRRAFYSSLTDQEKAQLMFKWDFWARSNQLPSPTLPSGPHKGELWDHWLLLAGRGMGKTRSGAELVRSRIETGEWKRVALVARTAADVRDVMIEGESGLLNVCPPWFRPKWMPSVRKLIWPNGAIATTYTSEEPAVLRGPQHDGAWADELASWRYTETWDNLQFGLRLGEHPQCVVTTTPRPTPIIKDLVKDPKTYITKGSTIENAKNLAPRFLKRILEKYEGTRLGRQEIYAELLEDNPDALWTLQTIETHRLKHGFCPPLSRIVVGVDPTVAEYSAKASQAEMSESLYTGRAETGIIVAGIAMDMNVPPAQRCEHVYILDDRSMYGSPLEWAQQVADTYDEWDADCVVAEINQGGALVETTLRTISPNIPVETVTASRGKHIRAEPVSSLYSKGRIHHVGAFSELENQMTQWSPTMDKKSPDRMDAMVWAVFALMLQKEGKILTQSNYAGFNTHRVYR